MQAATPRARVLAIDDSAINLAILEGLLGEAHDLTCAATGAEALAALAANPSFDLVLLDIMMPDMDGYEVLRRIRQEPCMAQVPVIFVTAMAAPAHERLGLELGAIDYLTKPLDPRQLIDRVEANLRTVRRHRDMDALATRLAPHLPPARYQGLFAPQSAAGITFAPWQGFCLAAAHGRLAGRDVHRLAANHGGRADTFRWSAPVLFFETEPQVLASARGLLQAAAGDTLQLGIAGGAGVLATFRLDGVEQCVLLGEVADEAERRAGRATHRHTLEAFMPTNALEEA